MKTINLTFCDVFKDDKITTKKICNRRTTILIKGKFISIEFDTDVTISKPYIDQISAFLRNYTVITGQIYRFEKTNLDIQYYYPLLNQSLLFSTSKEKPMEIQIDINIFFDKYRSKEKYYDYINNSIPWLIIFHQTEFFIEKIRLLFTLLEMLVVKYHISKNVGARYSNFYNSISISKRDENDFVNNMVDMWSNDNIKNSKEGFTGIAKMANGIINNHRGNNRDLISSFAYELRNRNFHGNMSPVIYMSSNTSSILWKLHNITINGIYEYLKKIVKEVT